MNDDAPIPQDWIKRQVDAILDLAKELGPDSAMGIACLARAEYYMDLVKAWRESQTPRVKCDGNHGGPRCADPECWNQ